MNKYSSSVLLRSRAARFAMALGIAVSVQPGPFNASAVNSPSLAFNRTQGLTISGSVGTICAVQYTTNLAQTPISWRCLNFFKLPAASAVVPGTIPTAAGNRFYRVVTMTAPTNTLFITSGTFTLGSPVTEEERFNDEGPQTTVTITRGICMSLYPVTQKNYQTVTGTNPSAFTGDLSRPVEQVSWYDASNYCRLLTQQERTAGRILAGCEYRLPTEAEWEYACRAGTTTRFYYGDDSGYLNLTNHAWYTDNAIQTYPVGQKPANPWGLYDMCGNVWEWCQDWYGPYPGATATDPQGVSTGSFRVLRGGSWTDDGRLCRSACRIGDDPAANYYSFYGFRVVLAPGL